MEFSMRAQPVPLKCSYIQHICNAQWAIWLRNQTEGKETTKTDRIWKRCSQSHEI